MKKKTILVTFATVLFTAVGLVSCGTHQHSYVEVEEIPATCIETGMAKHYTCSGCDKIFDSEKNEVTLDSLILNKIPHTMHTNNAVAATCTTAGNIKFYDCTACEKLFTDEAGTTEITAAQTIIPEEGHKTKVVVGQPSTCIVNGWKNHYQCETCAALFEDKEATKPISNLEAWKIGNGKLPLADHTYGNPDYEWSNDYSECTATHVCTVVGCEHEESEVASGTQITYVKDTDATCLVNEKGHNHAEFIIGDFEDQSSPANSVEKPSSAKGHHPVLVNGKASTCIENGWKDYYKCDRDGCNALFEDEAMENPIEDLEVWKAGKGQLPLAAHTYGNPDYEWSNDYSECTASHVCTVTGCLHEETEVASDGKITFVPDYPATCEDDELGHNHAVFVNLDFEAQDSGTGTVKGESKLGHHVEKVDGKPSSCFENGWKDYYKCDRDGCNALFEDEAMENPIEDLEVWKAGKGQLPLAAHTYGDPDYDWNDDYSECTASRVCTVVGCGHEDVEVASGDAVTFVHDSDPTCTEPEKGHNHAVFVNEAFAEQDSPKDSVSRGDPDGHDISIVKGVASTCCEYGWKDYYQCETCKEYFEDEDATIPITNLADWKVGDGRLPLDEHDFDETTHQCSVCKRYDVANTGVLRDSSLYTTDASCAEIDPANGFAEVHLYTGTMHATVADRKLFNTTSVLDEYEEIRFAIKIKEDATYKFLRAYYGGQWYKTGDFDGGEWATIIATRKNADGTDYSTWRLTTSRGDFLLSDTPLEVPVTPGLTFNTFLNILYSNGDPDLDKNIYMSEILGLKLCEFEHVKGTHHDAVEANCDHGGNVEYWDCLVCGTAIDSSSQIIENPYTPVEGDHSYNSDGFCTKCNVQKFDYNDIRASSNVTYEENTTATKLPSFAEVYDVTTNMTTNPEWGFLKAGFDFGALNYKKISFGVKVNDNGNDSDTFGFQDKSYAYYYIEGHNYGWVTVNVEKIGSNYVLTVDGARIHKNGGGIVDSVILAGSTFRDIGLRTSDLATIQMTEVKGYFAGEHIHDFDENMYCEGCGQYLLSYTKNDGQYPSTTILQNPENISATTINGPEDFGKFYKYSGTTGGGTSGGFFAHTGLSSLGINTTWESFKFCVYNTDAINARINTAKIDEIGQASSQKAIGKGFTQVEFVLEEIDEVKYWNLYLNGVAQDIYYKRANTMFAIFQLLTDSSEGFYITEVTYVTQQA